MLRPVCIFSFRWFRIIFKATKNLTFDHGPLEGPKRYENEKLFLYLNRRLELHYLYRHNKPKIMHYFPGKRRVK